MFSGQVEITVRERESDERWGSSRRGSGTYGHSSEGWEWESRQEEKEWVGGTEDNEASSTFFFNLMQT